MDGLEIPAAGAEIDGYRLVRPIGQGGFGTVWLCWSEASQSYHALKWIAGDAAGLKLELTALRRFREISQKLRSPHLIAIEHINLFPSGLIYTLPLADGVEGGDPSAESWQPMTLANRIEGKRAPWFSSAEILHIILPIIRATASLNDEGLVHRDIKPANILFFGGVPCLADIGLLSNDSVSLSQRGTPGFLPPSWYLESSGQPDMWGLATTLYSLLTGNNPDKMGRPKFLWPPAGKDSLSPSEQREWQRLHSVIYRATHEKATERFRDFQTFAAAVEGTSEPNRQRTSRFLPVVIAGLVLVGVLAWFLHGKLSSEKRTVSLEATPALASETPHPDSTGLPSRSSDQALSSTRQRELDNDAAAVTKKLEAHKVNSTGELQAFRDQAATVTKKMRAFVPKHSMTDGIKETLAASFPEMDGPSEKATTEKAVQANRDDPGLLEIRDELQSLVKNLPAASLKEEMEAANRLYQSLVDAVYSKTKTADEKFYFNDHIRPRLEQEFQRIFKWEPGVYPYDTTGMNLELALASPKWSFADKTVVAEIQSAIKQIKSQLESK